MRTNHRAMKYVSLDYMENDNDEHIRLVDFSKRYSAKKNHINSLAKQGCDIVFLHETCVLGQNNKNIKLSTVLSCKTWP